MFTEVDRLRRIFGGLNRGYGMLIIDYSIRYGSLTLDDISPSLYISKEILGEDGEVGFHPFKYFLSYDVKWDLCYERRGYFVKAKRPCGRGLYDNGYPICQSFEDLNGRFEMKCVFSFGQGRRLECRIPFTTSMTEEKAYSVLRVDATCIDCYNDIPNFDFVIRTYDTDYKFVEHSARFDTITINDDMVYKNRLIGERWVDEDCVVVNITSPFDVCAQKESRFVLKS